MSKIYKFNYHWLNELSKHKDMLDNDTRILVTYIEVLQQENNQLKEKIDILLEDNNQLEEIRIKAIDYINKRMIREGEYYFRKAKHFRNTEFGKDLLQLLGEDRDE